MHLFLVVFFEWIGKTFRMDQQQLRITISSRFVSPLGSLATNSQPPFLFAKATSLEYRKRHKNEFHPHSTPWVRDGQVAGRASAMEA